MLLYCFCIFNVCLKALNSDLYYNESFPVSHVLHGPPQHPLSVLANKVFQISV